MPDRPKRAEPSVIDPRRITPIKGFLFICLVWAVLATLAPVELALPDSLYPYLLLGGSAAALLIGLCLFEPKTLPALDVDRTERRRLLTAMFKACTVLGTLGVTFRLIDWVVYRGFSFDLEFAENLERAAEGGGNPFAAVAVYLVPLSIVPYLINLVAIRNGKPVSRGFLALGLALLWPACSIFIGQRGTLVMNIAMLFIGRTIIVRKTSGKLIPVMVLLLLGLIYLAGLIFMERSRQFGVSPDAVLRFAQFTHLAPLTQEYYNFASGAPTWAGDLVFISTSMSQYALHGVPEFFHLVEHYRHGDQLGAFTFTAMVRVASILWGVPFSLADVAMLPPRPGIYTTMFGPFYIDWGPFTPVFCLIFGGFVSWVRRRVLLGDLAALPLYVVLLIQTSAAPILNTISGAYGIFYDMAFAGLWIIVAASSRRASLRPAAA